MKEAALEYLAKGWSVIPLNYMDKRPAVPWAQYHERLPTKAEVESWFASPRNVGIVTGAVSGLVVVDFDPKHGGDHKPFLAKYPTGLTAQTGSGGVHAYYRYPAGQKVGNRVGVLPGVDIRGDGGQVVAPPSVHANSQKYQWIDTGEPSLFPMEVLGDNPTVTNERGWMAALLEHGAPSGQRDDACTKLAGAFYSQGSSAEICIQVLRNWNLKNRPPMDEEDISKCVKSVYRKAAANDAKKPTASKLRETAASFQLEGFENYMQEHTEAKPKWIVPDWLPDQTIAFVVSPPGTYKTWTILDLAISVATGTPFLGKYPVEQTGPVFLIQQEDFAGQTASRMSAIYRSRFSGPAVTITEEDGEEVFHVDLPDVPILIHTERKLRFDDARAMAQFAEAVALHKPRLVILDPLYSAGNTEDFMAKTAENMMIFKDLRDKYGTTFLVCHHTRKSGDNKSRDRLWGSQFLNAFLETGWQLSLEKTATVRFHRHFKSAQNPKDTVLHFDISTDMVNAHYRVTEVNSSAEEDEEDQDFSEEDLPHEEKVMKCLTFNRGQYFTVSSLSRITGIARRSLDRILAKLVEDKRVEQKDKLYGSLEALF